MPGEMDLTCTPCAPMEPGERLLSAFEKRDLPGFLAALQDVSVADPHCVTCLHRAAEDPALAEYLARLLTAGVEPNVQGVGKKTPVQVAAQKNNAAGLLALLRDKRTDVSVVDQFGNSPLLLVVQGQGSPDVQASCVSHLLNHNQLDVNHKNRKGHSAVLQAAKKCPIQVVQALLKHPSIDLDHSRFLDGSTARTLLEANFAQLRGQLPSSVADKALTDDELMRMLYYGQDQTKKFCTLVKEGACKDLNHHDGKDTLLQRACADGLLDAVGTLLAQGADPNKTCPGVKTSRTPFLLACAAGHADVAQLLSDGDRTEVNARTEEGDTALIQLIRSWDGMQGGYQKCLKLLLSLQTRGIDINASNERGETALHYAAITGDNALMLALLKNGAYIGGANRMNRLPLFNIPYEVMETHLNDCLTNHQSHFSENYRIEFDYSFLVPPRRKPPQEKSVKLLDSKVDCEIGDVADELEDPRSYPESEPLLFMSRKPNLRPLLKHPVLTSFMELKWQRLVWIFRFNIIFYLLFVASITTHILIGNGRYKRVSDSPVANGENSNASNLVGNPGYTCLQWVAVGNNTLGVTDTASTDDIDDKADQVDWNNATFNDTVQIISIVLLIIFALREIFQFVVSPKRYLSWSNRENYFEILLIISSSVVLFHNSLQPYFAAITILLSWGELVLLVGRHPMLSTYIEMLKTVSWNFLKFLSWYAILIVAFALSFYTLFRDNTDEDNFFVHPGLAVFKTVVMLTGEFDATGIPFVEFPGVSHVVFVMFVFLIAIVLFNLLNGLAVSDTQAIKDDAELVGYVSRVRLVAYIERMALGNSSWSSRCPSMFTRRVTLFHDSVNVAGHVLPNQGSALWVGPRGEKRDAPPRDSCRLNCDVIKKAEYEIAMKDSPTELEQIKKALDDATARLAGMEAIMKGMQKMVKELVNNIPNRDRETS